MEVKECKLKYILVGAVAAGCFVAPSYIFPVLTGAGCVYLWDKLDDKRIEDIF